MGSGAAVSEQGADVGGSEQRAWLLAAAAGDEAAVRRLVDEAGPVVYGFVYARVGGDESAAADLLQETLLEAVRGAQGFRGDAALSTWLCVIAQRRLARHYERERRQQVARHGLQVLQGGGEPADHHVAELDVARRDEVVRALGQLPPLHRQVLVLKYLDGRSVEEIAAELGKERVQVQSLLQRARDGLRREMGTDGG